LAQAGVTAERTRVIFPAGASETSLQVANLNAYPVLVQVWVDDGKLDSTPDKAIAPIMPLPPEFRMSPSERRSLRLIFTGDKLPTDRESLYWLNIYEIPPSDAGTPVPAEQPRLLVTMHTQMKVFYRPKKLPLPPEQAASKLGFSLVQAGGETVLRVDNPSPYYVTLRGLELSKGGSKLAVKGDMVAPFSHMDLPLAASTNSPTGVGRVRFTWIDDDGNPQEAQAPLP
jgi:P pilus assembly chaperone PapD